MREGARAGSITYSARPVGGGAGSRTIAAEQQQPHRSAGECTRFRSAELPLVATARRTIAACNVARYS